MKNDNAGMSLVEMIVTIAIISIVMLAAYRFVSSASSNYLRQTREVKVQQEAQITLNQIKDLMIDAKKGISYDEASNTLTIYNSDLYYDLIWDSASSEIYFKKTVVTSTDTGGVITYSFAEGDEKLLAEYVTNFSVNLDNLDAKGIVLLDLTYTNEDKSFTTSHSLNIRNKVLVNKARNEIYN